MSVGRGVRVAELAHHSSPPPHPPPNQPPTTPPPKPSPSPSTSAAGRLGQGGGLLYVMNGVGSGAGVGGSPSFGEFRWMRYRERGCVVLCSSPVVQWGVSRPAAAGRWTPPRGRPWVTNTDEGPCPAMCWLCPPPARPLLPRGRRTWG